MTGAERESCYYLAIFDCELFGQQEQASFPLVWGSTVKTDKLSFARSLSGSVSGSDSPLSLSSLVVHVIATNFTLANSLAFSRYVFRQFM